MAIKRHRAGWLAIAAMAAVVAVSAYAQSPESPGAVGTQSDSWTPPPIVPHASNRAMYGASTDWGRYSIGRIVAYSYSPDETYTILTRPLAVTDIALAPGEKLITLNMGDTSRWITSDDKYNIYIKPVRAGLYTAATLQTTLHRYQLVFVSVQPGATWYQQVSWNPGGMTVLRGNTSSNADPQDSSSGSGASSQQPSPADPPSGGSTGSDGESASALAHIDTDYSIKGHAPWRPISVYDNGRSTVFRLPSQLQEMPALFVQSTAGAPFGVVNYEVRGKTLVYPHLIHAAVLRLGNKKVVIKRRAG